MININEQKLKNKYGEIKSYLEYYDEYGQPLVEEYAHELDDKVNSIKTYMSQIKEYDLEADIPSLQQILIELSSTIYFANDGLEKLNLMADMSKIIYKDVYNNAYLTKQGNTEAGKKFSVPQLQAYADTEALEENLINFIYQRACSVLNSKIDSANDLLKACSKILSSRIQELQTFGVGGKYKN